MRILGIDTGFALLGWAVIDKDGLKNKMVDYGVIKTDSTMEMEDRLFLINEELEKIIRQYKPEEVAIESLFFFKNQKTVMTVSQARGVIILTCRQCNLDVFNYTPLQVKTAVTGYGRAEKAQIQTMIKLIFKLKEIPQPDDAADAIAIAYCHSTVSKRLKMKNEK